MGLKEYSEVAHFSMNETPAELVTPNEITTLTS